MGLSWGTILLDDRGKRKQQQHNRYRQHLCRGYGVGSQGSRASTLYLLARHCSTTLQQDRLALQPGSSSRGYTLRSHAWLSCSNVVATSPCRAHPHPPADTLNESRGPD